MSHLESSDRGITLDKSLAWTIGIALIGGGFWVGVTLSQMQAQNEQLSAALGELRTDLTAERAHRGSLAERLNTLERSDARTDQRLVALVDSVQRVERQTVEILRYVRGLPNANE